MNFLDTFWGFLPPPPPPSLLITDSFNGNFLLFKNLILQGKFEEAKAIVNIERPIFEYVLFCAKIGIKPMIDFFFSRGVSPNVEDKNGKNLLYCLGDNTEMAKYIHGKGYDLQQTDTWFHPLLASVEYGTNSELLTYYINSDSPLDVKDHNGLTVLMKLVKLGNLNHIKYFCGRFRCKYGDTSLTEYINEKNIYGFSALDLASLTDNFDIAKFLIEYGAQCPYSRILETKYGYKKIVFLTPIKVAIVNTRITFHQFCTKLQGKACLDWSGTKLPQIRQIYNLPYPKDIILRASLLTCEKNLSHDKDSVLMFCTKLVASQSASIIQNIYRKSKKRKRASDSILKIQRAWRRRKYTQTLQRKCTICTSTLNLAKCCKLPCNHFFHAFCINKWRKTENKCPICRTSINRYPVHL